MSKWKNEREADAFPDLFMLLEDKENELPLDVLFFLLGYLKSNKREV